MSDVVRSSELARSEGRNDVFTYRGRDLDELLPRIREELGPDAIVIRQREGLDGGIAGFFQKRCVEVVARPATPGVDAYDGADEPVAVAPEPPAPAIAEIMRVASPFIEQLRAAEEEVPQEEPVTGAFGTTAYAMTSGSAALAVAPAAEEEPVQAPLALVPDAAVVPDEPAAVASTEVEPAGRTGAAAAHERALVAAGIAPARAAEIVEATISHVLPFEPRRTLKRALREALARRIPLTPPVAAGGRAIAFVGAGGSGKTLCATRLATAYDEHSDLAVTTLDLRDAPHAPVRTDGTLTVLDTPAVSPGSAAEVKKLASALRRLGSPEVHVAVPATLSSSAVRTLLDGLAPLKPAAIALTHLDEVEHAGPVIDEAIARAIAISYTSDGGNADGFGPADPDSLAARILA